VVEEQQPPTPYSVCGLAQLSYTFADGESERLYPAMSNVEQYAASTVEKYHVAADTEPISHRAADEVIPHIKKWGKQFLDDIKLSGAYSKNTAVSLSSDVDVLITLNPVPGREMKKIFWSLFEYLSDQDLRPETRRVSIQVLARKMKVDLIPAYRDRGRTSHILFNKKSGSEVHTDLAQHVHLVGNSGRQQEICALKIWRERNKFDFPSLYLERTVLKALETEPYGKLSHNLLSALRYIGNRFEKAVVRDPANEDNIVSNDLSMAEKTAIAKAARDVTYDENWKRILW
jgi:hypothetical protein